MLLSIINSVCVYVCVCVCVCLCVCVCVCVYGAYVHGYFALHVADFPPPYGVYLVKIFLLC